MIERRSAGDAIRSIREAKGYTQKFVSDGIIRQSTYSKIERDEIEPAASKFFSLLDRIEMTVDEFLFIQNKYSYSEKGSIIRMFVSQTYNDPELLKDLKQKALNYLKENDDDVIQDITMICEALIILSKSPDLEESRKYVFPVWDRLERFDQWFLTELYLVNNILYFFPTESAIYIAHRAIEQLEKYRGFRASNRLRFNFQFNLIYLLLRDKEYSTALSLLEDLISEAKELKYHELLAICYSRKGIALINTGEKEGKLFMEKGLHMLEIIEEKELLKKAEEEIQNFLK